MKLFIKRIIALALICIMTLGCVNVEAATNIKYVSNSKKYTYKGDTYKVYFNKELVNSSVRPAIMKNNSYMIPYKYSLVKNGPKLNSAYVSQTKCINLSLKDTRVKMYIGKKIIYVNNVKKKLKTAPMTVTCGKFSFVTVPLAEICDAFGWDYKVLEKTKSIYITATSDTLEEVDDDIKVSEFKKMSTSQFLAKMGPIAREDYKKTGILASVTLAQAILESGWGKSGLTQKSNNLFGIKASKSNWRDSTWEGKYVTVNTKEVYGGKTVTISARFRKYSSVSDSIADHSAYLRYSKNGSKYRYAGITATTSYKAQLRIIQNGGYCTGNTYYSQLCTLISRYNLTRWDR